MAMRINSTPGQQRRYRQQRVRTDQDTAAHPILWRALLLFGLALGIGLYYVSLTKNRDDLQRRFTALEKSSSNGAKEIDNLKMQLESFKNGRYVLTKAEENNLKLRPPLPGQVQRMPSTPAGRTEYTADGFSSTMPEEIAPPIPKSTPPPMRVPLARKVAKTTR